MTESAPLRSGLRSVLSRDQPSLRRTLTIFCPEGFTQGLRAGCQPEPDLRVRRECGRIHPGHLGADEAARLRSEERKRAAPLENHKRKMKRERGLNIRTVQMEQCARVFSLAELAYFGNMIFEFRRRMWWSPVGSQLPSRPNESAIPIPRMPTRTTLNVRFQQWIPPELSHVWRILRGAVPRSGPSPNR